MCLGNGICIINSQQCPNYLGLDWFWLISYSSSNKFVLLTLLYRRIYSSSRFHRAKTKQLSTISQERILKQNVKAYFYQLLFIIFQHHGAPNAHKSGDSPSLSTSCFVYFLFVIKDNYKPI